ncbi:MAG: metallophosphoesterase family protein [Erysipelotrichales bacterium]|nr:metallophosphoesterase family protein [Erysipelotrichales bacterium]
MNNKISDIISKSRTINIDDKSKIVIMSDCHRGEGNSDDNFLRNEVIHMAALKYYLNQDYTYVELGDGDDLWEVKEYGNVVLEHLDVFKLLSEFHKKGKLIMIVGNHDNIKKDMNILEKYFYFYDNPDTQEYYELLNGLEIEDGLTFKYKGEDICLLHGHQVDLLNGPFWKLSRFLVRYVWRYLERTGIKDPTNAAKNYEAKKRIDKRLKKWSEENNKILIAGHTHRPIYPKVGSGLYFNDGSCIHPNGVTCIEIENGNISLVKWVRSVDDNNNVIVTKSVIAGPTPILDFFE